MLRAFGIPENTRKDTKYCHGLWVEWTMYRRKNGDVIPPLEELSKEQMCYWLTRFVMEVRKSV